MRIRYGAASTEKTLGALPVVAGFCRRLDIAGIIDRAAPVRSVAYATHGQVIEALIANRLTSPAPMVHVGAWARQFAVGYLLGLDPDVLNDDRITRALDALAPVLEQVTGSVGAAAIGAYGVDISQLHWDMTSVSLYGDYAAREEEFPAPRFGHPKDRRPDLKQIQAGVATAADGAVPVFWQPYSGGAGEVSQVVGAMEALRRLAGPRRFLLVGDSKLLSYPNIAAMIGAKVTFLAPASKSFVPAEVLAGCDYEAASPVRYVAQRDMNRPADQRGQYRVVEGTTTITGPRKTKDPSFTLRRVFVHSSARAGAAATARAKKLDRARDDLGRLCRGLGSRHYPTAEAVTTRVNTIARERRVGDYLRTTIGTDHNKRPTLDWHFDQAATDAEAATDGWYALLTNLPASITAGQVLARYKNQPGASERRYHDFKGPLAVAPMFLHTNRRITALIGVVCLALLIYCLVEREARRNLAPATQLDGLYAGRPAKPTAGLIFNALATLRLRTNSTPEIPQPDPLQQRLLDLLKIDPRHTS
ncbi:MAG: IS1634 family transposase [Jiangellaceae bacterium]